MTDGHTTASESQSAAERLLEDSWEARARARASRRELIVEAAAGVLFLAAWAGLLVAQDAARPLQPATVGLLVVLYVVVARVEFPVGTGHGL
ncbi:MAG TPA: hypothetical protein VFM58_14920, partial [Solirubrobacteraceae bacterium]|nr:hypothetical protein [Solirubrobacteraceae bacterium]